MTYKNAIKRGHTHKASEELPNTPNNWIAVATRPLFYLRFSLTVFTLTIINVKVGGKLNSIHIIIQFEWKLLQSNWQVSRNCCDKKNIKKLTSENFERLFFFGGRNRGWTLCTCTKLIEWVQHGKSFKNKNKIITLPWS